jgi:hypothetical protein
MTMYRPDAPGMPWASHHLDHVVSEVAALVPAADRVV